jgi:putative endonuclease
MSCPPADPFFVYILQCADGNFYIGRASDPEARVIRHNESRGALWTSRRRPVELVYSEARQGRQRAVGTSSYPLSPLRPSGATRVLLECHGLAPVATTCRPSGACGSPDFWARPAAAGGLRRFGVHFRLAIRRRRASNPGDRRQCPDRHTPSTTAARWLPPMV